MIDDYPYRDIMINGRLVQLSDVINHSVKSLSDFEREVFEFTSDWFTGKKTFQQNTSGSTGSPKPIAISREQMIASAALTRHALGLKKNQTSLLCIDPKFIGGKMMLVRSFVVGMKLICIEPSANPLSFLPADQCVNFAAFVPYQIENILVSNDPHSLDNIEIAIIGGAPISSSTVAKLYNHKASCYATYGMTETISHIALQKLNGSNRQQHFTVLSGITITKDNRGCLVVEVPYLKEPLITNDLVDIVEPGGFRILGRWDNVINTGGFKVFPEKVEAAIEKIPEIAASKTKFFIHGLPDKILGQKVSLIVEAASGTVVNWQEMLKKLSLSLARHELPKDIAVVESFINTESGKINRLQTVKNIQSITALKTQS